MITEVKQFTKLGLCNIVHFLQNGPGGVISIALPSPFACRSSGHRSSRRTGVAALCPHHQRL